MRLRYIGPDKVRDLPLPGGLVAFEKGKWVDLRRACEAARIPLHHLEVIVTSLAEHPHWELDTKPARKPKETDQ